MATVNPLLDPPSQQSGPAPAPQSQNSEPPNLILGVLRRWPWLALGLTVGLVLGFLFHMQRPPVYQSAAQLLVVKSRPDLVAGGAGDARVQYVEDYIGPQVILLGSETILKLASEKWVDQQGPYTEPPPPAGPGRVAFLKSRFAVTREKEPGTNNPSNVLLLTFKSPHPADAPRYLQAIIAAYRDELSGAFEDASTRQLKQIDADIARFKKSQADTVAALRESERQLRGVVDPATGALLVPGVSQEDPLRVQQRISTNRDAMTTLELRRIENQRILEEIKSAAGKSRAERVALMTRLNIPVDRPSLFGDARDPESMLAHLKFKQGELAVRLGRGHPDMIALAAQIKALEAELGTRGGPGDDELERYRRKVENEQSGIAAQLKVLAKNVEADEETVRKVAPIQQAIRNHEETLRRDATELQQALRDKERVSGSRTTGGYDVRDITKPGEGVQVAPVLVQSLLLGGVFGLLLGGLFGLRSEIADRSFRSPADIRRRLGLPVLGHVPPIKTTEPPEVKPVAAVDPVLAVLLRPKSAESEAVRGIRTQLMFSTQNKVHQVIQVTSPSAGDGKSTLAANLAISLARADKRVVLVDCDFRKPRVHKLFALADPSAGLASVVADQSDLGDAIQGCEVDNLSLLPCGPRPSNPSELLSSPRFQEVLDDLRASYDFVILDTPPVLAVSDPTAVAPRADGIILVFRMTTEAGPMAEHARNELAGVGGRILGVVVNGSTGRDMGYGYGYKYESGYTDRYADKQ